MSHDVKAKAWEEAQNGPPPGSRWKHYEGGFYTVVGPCIIRPNAEPGLTYKSESYGTVVAISLKVFHEFMPKHGKHRFEQCAVDNNEELQKATRKGFYGNEAEQT